MIRYNRLQSRHRRSRPLRRSLVVLATCALAVTGCGSGGGKSATASGKPLTIGASLSLTGDFSDSGKAAQRGYELWAQTVNAHGGILGRKVKMTIVDDTSSPDQVITNYQDLINRNKVDLVFGPFSSLLTAPAARVASRYGYAFIEPAGGGPTVFAEKLHNLFFVQPAPTVDGGTVFANYVLSLPKAQRPKTAAYPELDDPFAHPEAELVRKRFEAAGIKTVYRATYPSETTDMTPTVSKVVAAEPDMIVAGTQSEDAYGIVKALVQLHYNPKMMFMANGASSALNFPGKVGMANVDGIFSSSDWTPQSTATGSAAFVKAYLAKYGGTADQIDNTSVEAYTCGQLLQAVARKTGKVDNATVISTLHQGSWPTAEGNLSWNSVGEPQGNDLLVQWQAHKLLLVGPGTKTMPIAVKPAWGK